MPSLPPPTAPYPNMNDILNAARVRVNDALAALPSTGGRILRSETAFTQQAVLNAWHRLQDILINLGYTRLVKEVIVTGLPMNPNPDPASQAFINWTNYFDGEYYWTSPVLPQDLTFPLKVWQRWSGQNMPFPIDPMEYALDGIPNTISQSFNLCWEWRSDSIYLTGATQPIDLRIRYASYLPDIVDTTGVRWFRQPVPITNCQDSFSWLIVYEFLSSRSPESDTVEAEAYIAKAEAAVKYIFNRDVKMKQRVTATRQPLSGRGRGGWGGYGDC